MIWIRACPMEPWKDMPSDPVPHVGDKVPLAAFVLEQNTPEKPARSLIRLVDFHPAASLNKSSN